MTLKNRLIVNNPVATSSLGIIVTWLIVTVAASVFAAIFYPVYKRTMRSTNPLSQAFSLLIYAIIPPFAAIIVVLLLIHPSLSGGLIPDHCHSDTCDSHSPEITLTSYVGIALVALSSLTLLTIILFLKLGLTRANRHLRTLDILSRHGGDINYRVIDSPEMLAWCAGVLQPKIYLSRGLLDQLNNQQLQAVVVHELVHIARRDNLRKLAVRYASVFWPPPLKSLLLNDFSVKTEQACDHITTARLDNPALVAEVLKIMTDNAKNNFPRTSEKFEEHDLSLGHLALSTPTVTARFATSDWLVISIIWIAAIIFLPVLTHLGLEWLTI